MPIFVGIYAALIIGMKFIKLKVLEMIDADEDSNVIDRYRMEGVFVSVSVDAIVALGQYKSGTKIKIITGITYYCEESVEIILDRING